MERIYRSTLVWQGATVVILHLRRPQRIVLAIRLVLSLLGLSEASFDLLLLLGRHVPKVV